MVYISDVAYVFVLSLRYKKNIRKKIFEIEGKKIINFRRFSL